MQYIFEYKQSKLEDSIIEEIKMSIFPSDQNVDKND
jgi:hypothetical protein